jgi:hypothetical protein
MSQPIHQPAKHISKKPATGGILQRACACGQHNHAGGECAECKKKHLSLQRFAANQAEPASVPSIVHEVLRSPGQPLDPATRIFMEPRFGHDFSQVPTQENRSMLEPANLTIGAPHDAFEQEADMMAQRVMSQPANSTSIAYDFSSVRVHTDGKAAESARAVNALAYTVGRDIVFDAGKFAPETHGGRQLIAHELTHVVQQESLPAARHHMYSSITVSSAFGAPVIQRKLDCSLGHIEAECAGAAASCLTVKDYCKTKYPNPGDLDTLHANAVKGANEYKTKFPNAADNLLHFLDGSGTEKVMNVDIFRNHPATQKKYGDHMAKFKEGAKKRFDSGELKIGGPAVEMVWTDTANAFSLGDYSDLGLAVGGYTLCSKVSAKAVDPKEVGGSKDYLWVRFDPWTMQAFDCYNWDPGKGIGLPFATDNDFCCLENAGRAKHFRVRTDPWPLVFPPEGIRITPEKAPANIPTSQPPEHEDKGR